MRDGIVSLLGRVEREGRGLLACRRRARDVQKRRGGEEDPMPCVDVSSRRPVRWMYALQGRVASWMRLRPPPRRVLSPKRAEREK